MGESQSPGQPGLQRHPALGKNRKDGDRKEAAGCGRRDRLWCYVVALQGTRRETQGC